MSCSVQGRSCGHFFLPSFRLNQRAAQFQLSSGQGPVGLDPASLAGTENKVTSPASPGLAAQKSRLLTLIAQLVRLTVFARRYAHSVIRFGGPFKKSRGVPRATH